MEKSSEMPPPYTDAPKTDGSAGQAGYPANYNQQGYAAQYNYPPQAGQYPPGQYPPPAGQYPAQGGQYPAQGGQYPAQGGAPLPPGYQPQYQTQYGNVVIQQPMAYATSRGPPPQDHMCAAIFVTLCCFWPTGIVAIMRASDARAAVARGDMVGANSYARSAKSMITISVVIGIIAVIVMAIIIGVYVGVVLENIHDNDYRY
ncbi:proline-rich transmembrane protein 1 [Aplysia californica]|uniref:Proline-rich transmembrane protein 1 n=1 Tax=Aplysia californica TaxID=6500 RepID=A0ABM1A5Y6_APLCA|nr:proline-rich transmembrane protein 1 [Aplysia californica]